MLDDSSPTEAFHQAIQIDEQPMQPDPALLEVQEAPLMDWFTMVNEWSALKREVKQQNKQMHGAKAELSRALELIYQYRSQLQQELDDWEEEKESLRRLIQKNVEQEFYGQWKLSLKSLLPALDSLDYSVIHWESALQSHQAKSIPMIGSKAFWNRRELLESSLKGAIQQRDKFHHWLASMAMQPVAVLGHPFNPKTMMAIDQKATTNPKQFNTVAEELLRGWKWKTEVIRPSEVVVWVQAEG